LKSPQRQNVLLRIESLVRHTHHKQVKCKTNTIPILMHQVRISTNQVSSVVNGMLLHRRGKLTIAFNSIGKLLHEKKKYLAVAFNSIHKLLHEKKKILAVAFNSIQKLLHEKKKSLAVAFNSTFRYIDVLSININHFHSYFGPYIPMN
jgi:hypothetical protein